MREKIEKKRAAIWKSVTAGGRSEGTEIATKEEMRWLMEQAARDGILLKFRPAPEVYHQDDECYYYYSALWVIADKERVRDFVDNYPMSVSALNKLLPPTDINDPDENRAAEHIKQIRRLVQARDRRRRQRKLEDEQRELENHIVELMEAERDECYEHRDDLNWLVARIESMGWEVTIRRKQTPAEIRI